MALQFGCLFMPRSFETTRAAAVVAEEGGLAWFGVGDSPAVFEDAWLHLVEAARVTSTVLLGPMVTHVVIRHPLVVASQLAALNELSNGRVRGAVGTGNSAARGLGLAPATLAQMREAIDLMRGYWGGVGGRYGESVVPPSSIVRPAVPLFVAGDGPRSVALGGSVGDGVLYSGSLGEHALGRRVEAARSLRGRKVPVWVAVPASPAEDRVVVRRELGPVLVAMANRALRGDLAERGVPEALHDDVRAMHARYDYAAHGTFERPANAAMISDALADFLLDQFCITGGAATWASTLSRLEACGVDGLITIINQNDELGTLRLVVDRLTQLGAKAPRSEGRC
jgi:alkanesulfonate monooxygenase SsuD/methylene tetrahydromethanopterin reductase-like flavin-dependent oxidoreductase (luciferase family)